jgi:hypothetical protein
MNTIIHDLPEANYHADNIIGVEELTFSRGIVAKYHETKCLQEVYDAHPRLGGVKVADKPAWALGRLWHRYLADEDLGIDIIEADSYRSKQSQLERDASIAGGRTPMLAKDWPAFEGELKRAKTELERLGINGIETGKREVTMITDEVYPGMTLRVRADVFIDWGDRVLLVDWKTCTDLRDRAIDRAVSSYNYGFQAAFYTTVARKCYGKPVDWLWVFVRKENCRMRAATIDGDFLDHCKLNQVEPALESITEALKNNNWPGYKPYTVTMPKWMEAQDGPDIDQFFGADEGDEQQ